MIEDCKKNNKFVSIIIPTLNEEKTIGKLLDSIFSDKYPYKEVIVVDGGSVDNTVKIAKEKGARVIFEKRIKCPANARNLGAKVAKGEILCFLDGDTERVSKNFITEAVKQFSKDENIGGVLCKSEVLVDTFIEKVLVESTKSLFSSFVKRNLQKGYAYMSFIKKEIFCQAKFPLLGFGEDRVYWRRLNKLLKKYNLKTKYVPKSVIYKHLPHTIQEFLKQQIWYGRTIPYFIKNKEVSIFEKITSIFPIIFFFSFLFFILYLNTKIPIFLILGFIFIIRAAINIIEGLKNKYLLFLPIIDLLRGMSLIYGLIQFLLCKIHNKKFLSRG